MLPPKTRAPLTGDHIIIERDDNGNRWTVGYLTPDHDPGSLSSDHANGTREVYLFGWMNGNGPGVWLSNGGYDREVDTERVVIPIRGFHPLADLRDGPHTLDLHRPTRDGIRVRLTYRPAIE